VGVSSLYTGDIVDGRAQCNQALVLYDAAEHRSLATRFGLDSRVAILSYRSSAWWLLGYPEDALAGLDQTLKDGREIGHAPSLMHALAVTSITHLFLRNYAVVTAQADELVAVAEEKSALFWKALGTILQGCVLAAISKPSDAVQQITAGITAFQSTGATWGLPTWLSYLAKAYTDLRQFEDAWRCIDEAIFAVEKTKERWFEAEVNRIAGEIALKTSKPDAAKAETYFERALAVARKQQAKSWELRAAMSLARLWRSQGKPQQGRELLAPVYEWFTEGFDTRDLKEAKALLDTLAA
jgi:predicted ATPase